MNLLDEILVVNWVWYGMGHKSLIGEGPVCHKMFVWAMDRGLV